jgi:hypothetical protein
LLSNIGKKHLPILGASMSSEDSSDVLHPSLIITTFTALSTVGGLETETLCKKEFKNKKTRYLFNSR